MSTYEQRVLLCPHCGHSYERSVAVSINVARAPEVRKAILENTFQREPCAQCQTMLVADGPLMYIDFDAKHWIGVFPRTWEPAWRLYEHEPEHAFQRSMLEHAPAMVRSWAPGFTVRAVFGLAALREKLLCFDAGIDDRVLEALKLDMMRSTNRMRFSSDGRPLLIGADAARLVFHVAVLEENKVSAPVRPAELVMDRAHLRRIEENQDDAWSRALDEVSGGPYVDVGRLFLSGDAPRPADDPVAADTD